MSCEEAALPFQAHANYGTWATLVTIEKKKSATYNLLNITNS